MIQQEVYQPAEDTFLLLSACEDECRRNDSVLEIGCGTGCIAFSLKSRDSRRACRLVLATDINPHAVVAARSLGLDVVRADLLSGIRGPFDLVIFNPPYLPTDPEERINDWLEFALDGGPDGRAVISRFITTVDGVLTPEGRFLLLVSSLTGLEDVLRLIEDTGFRHEIVSRQNVEGEDLVVIRGMRKPAQRRDLPMNPDNAFLT
jgi:release factor glutamine methyltransferase